MRQDLEHLRLLSAFHYVVAALAALFSIFPVLHLVLGLGLMTGRLQRRADPAASFIGCFFVAFAALAILLGLAYAACMLIAGRNLAQHRHYLFCLVMAGISCAFVPFGTALGVFTILVLTRESVRELFGRPPAEERPAEAP
jgi:hypothetical protein